MPTNGLTLSSGYYHVKGPRPDLPYDIPNCRTRLELVAFPALDLRLVDGNGAPILLDLPRPTDVRRLVLLSLRTTGQRRDQTTRDQATEEHEERRGTPPNYYFHIILHMEV